MEDKLLGMLNVAMDAKRRGDFSTSIQLNRKIIELAPHDARAYKNIAKVYLGTDQYVDAMHNLLMYIRLGMFYTLRSSDCPIIESAINVKKHQMMTDSYDLNPDMPSQFPGNIFSEQIRIGNTIVPRFLVPVLLENNSMCFDIAKLMWAEDDLYFYLGHCYIRSFPGLFSSYTFPKENMKALELKLLGQQTTIPDLRISKEFAPVFYITGFILCVANIADNLANNSAEVIQTFYAKRLQTDLCTTVGTLVRQICDLSKS